MSPPSFVHPHVERALAVTALVTIVASCTCFVATLVVGLWDRTALASGLWPIVVAIAYLGLPLGFVAVVALLGINISRRGSRRDDGE